jgi:hypothetical protein
MADLWRDFWIRETGTDQQVAQLHDRWMMMISKERDRQESEWQCTCNWVFTYLMHLHEVTRKVIRHLRSCAEMVSPWFIMARHGSYPIPWQFMCDLFWTEYHWEIFCDMLRGLHASGPVRSQTHYVFVHSFIYWRHVTPLFNFKTNQTLEFLLFPLWMQVLRSPRFL